MFKITSVKRVNSHQVKASVSMFAKDWLEMKSKGSLGILYSTDISNAIARRYGVKARIPYVADYTKVVNNIKTFDLFFVDSTWEEKPSQEIPNNVIFVDFVNKKRLAA